MFSQDSSRGICAFIYLLLTLSNLFDCFCLLCNMSIDLCVITPGSAGLCNLALNQIFGFSSLWRGYINVFEPRSVIVASFSIFDSTANVKWFMFLKILEAQKVTQVLSCCRDLHDKIHKIYRLRSSTWIGFQPLVKQCSSQNHHVDSHQSQ